MYMYILHRLKEKSLPYHNYLCDVGLFSYQTFRGGGAVGLSVRPRSGFGCSNSCRDRPKS